MKQLHPRAVWLFFISALLRSLVILIILGIQMFMVLLSSKGGININKYIIWYILFVLFMIILMFIWAKLSYRFYKYELKDNGFSKEQGVIWKKYVTIPYDRIQNVDIYRGVWARILGLSDLNIQTAGAAVQMSRAGMLGGSEGRLLGLSKEDAEKLRDELVSRANSKNIQRSI